MKYVNPPLPHPVVLPRRMLPLDEDALIDAYRMAGVPPEPSPVFSVMPEATLTMRQAELAEEAARQRQAAHWDARGFIMCAQPACMNLLVLGCGWHYCRDHRS